MSSADPPWRIVSILNRDKTVLEAALGLEGGSARIEVQCLLQAALKVSRTWLLTHCEQTLNIAQYRQYLALFERRINGEPVSYILGKREFYGLTFKVTPATLIPRHDTELLVELALQRIPSLPAPLPKCNPHPTPHPEGERKEVSLRDFHDNEKKHMVRVLDLGTGSGAVALSIAHTRQDVEIVAVDASMEALKVAEENRRLLGVNNLSLLYSDWFSVLEGERFDLIVSNPPYIASTDAHLMQGDLRFEPRTALVSGRDGLDDIRHITARASAHLNTHGWLLFEHGYDQAVQARDLLRAAGLVEVFSSCDLSGIERVSGGKIPAKSQAG